MAQPESKEQLPPPSINDTLETSNPSLKTVLIVFGCLVLAIVSLVLYSEFA